MKKLTIITRLKNVSTEELLEEIRRREIEKEKLSPKPWAKYFGDWETDPCSEIKRPENIPNEIFYKACYLTSQWEWWVDDPDEDALNAAWAQIYELNKKPYKGEGLFDQP